MSFSRLDPLPLEPESLYITLSDIGDKTEFHWALYLAKNPKAEKDTGILYHATNRTVLKEFRFQVRHDYNPNVSVTFLTAVRIAVIHPDLWDSLGNLLSPPDVHSDGSLPIDESTTCRTWVFRALQILDDFGYIKLKDDALQKVEKQCLEIAQQNLIGKDRTVQRSLYSIA
ncbi:hypothetical protein BGAL_0251g00030 [Botrytis galanthina]|uniref:Uncharacterized protein n=1 Tax=Botrytis galanthina TaxID=278940 RepID=A0A4S8QT37_9HELO|nr:hypothetical protein BGAL_0251g00030 [Botrytis galanthina]